MQFFLRKVDGRRAVVPRDPDSLIGFGVEMATKLAQIEELGVVLVDFKPDNVINNGSEHILVDLGVSVRKGLQPTGATFSYSSPDITDPQGLDSRHDTYCLASVMTEALLGQTPNDIYGNLFALSPADRQRAYQGIYTRLQQACYPNARLAEVLAAGLNPDRKSRPYMHTFATQMEEISPQFIAFPTIKADEINRIDSFEGVGALLAKLKKGMLYRRTDIPQADQQDPYLANTNLDILGKIGHALEDPRQVPGYFSGNSATARAELFKDLRRSYETNTIPRYLTNSAEQRGRQMTPREKQSVQFAITLHNLAKRFPDTAEELYSENFVNFCLQILEDPDGMKNYVATRGHPAWSPLLRRVLNGFDTEQRPAGNHTPLTFNP